MQGIPLAFQSAPTTTDPGMSAAMQRMYAANDIPTSINERTLNEGVQADDAFGNLYAILGANEQQMRNSREIALTGDERRINESLAAAARGMETGVDLAMANALEQYEKDKFQYGVEVADRNWQKNIQQATHNQTGRQETMGANVAARNDANKSIIDTLLGLIAQGVQISEADLAGLKLAAAPAPQPSGGGATATAQATRSA